MTTFYAIYNSRAKRFRLRIFFALKISKVNLGGPHGPHHRETLGSKRLKVVAWMANIINSKIIFRNQEADQPKMIEKSSKIKNVAQKVMVWTVSKENILTDLLLTWDQKTFFSKMSILVQSKNACEITFENGSISAILLALRPPMCRFWAPDVVIGSQPDVPSSSGHVGASQAIANGRKHTYRRRVGGVKFLSISTKNKIIKGYLGEIVMGV